MAYSHVKRFKTSGAIGSAGELVKICGIKVVGFSSDSQVVIYDSPSAGPEATEVWQTALQPGVPDNWNTPFRLHDGGYITITGTAKVFLFLE